MPKQLQIRLQEAMSALLTKPPPIQMIADYEEERSEHLQEFCINHRRPELRWITGLGVIEAAKFLVDGATENANIDVDGKIGFCG